MTPTRAAALYLASRGIAVFPLHTPSEAGCSCGKDDCGKNEGKHPRTKKGLSEATTDQGIINGWWDQWPEANVGALAGPESGFWVLDIDADTPGEDWLCRCLDEHGELPATRIARTGGGGAHYFWRYDNTVIDWLEREGYDLPSRNGIAPYGAEYAIKGIDVKAAGGYLVMPPSLHRLGSRYEWRQQVPTAHAPEWLLRAVARKRRPEPGRVVAPPLVATGNDDLNRKWAVACLRNACAYIAGAEHGHDIIRGRSRLIGGIVARGWLTREEAEEALIQAGLASGRKAGEVARTVAWGLTKGEEQPIDKPPSRWEQREQERAEQWGSSPAEAQPPQESASGDEDEPEEPAHDREPGEGDEDEGEVGPATLPHLTDVGNAEVFIRLHGANMRWCDAIPGEGWLVWDGNRWQVDRAKIALRRASKIGEWWRDQARDLDDEDGKSVWKWARQSEGIARIRGAIELAKADPVVVVQTEALDADPWKINMPGVTVDLKRGRRYTPDRADLITRMTGVAIDPEMRCPTWLAFLREIMGGDEDMVGFLQRAVGYSLTGDTSEQCLFVLHGTGANGKSTFIEACRLIMGDYGRNTPIETFTVRREGGIPNDLAALAGARFVTAAESQENMSLNEALVKQATGDDVITARFLNREFFDYKPKFKAWIALNHKPRVQGTDEGIWRRLRLVPFNVTIPKEKRDRTLKDRIHAEGPGILGWALEGAFQWLEGGLRAPAAVLAATEAYRTEMDQAAAWLEECCYLGAERGSTLVSELYQSYVNWCKENGVHPKSAKWLGTQLDAKKIERNARNGDGRRRNGIALIVRANQNIWVPRD